MGLDSETVTVGLAILTTIGGGVWKVWSSLSARLTSFFDWAKPHANEIIAGHKSLLATCERSIEETTGHVAKIDQKLTRVDETLASHALKLDRIESNTKR